MRKLFGVFVPLFFVLFAQLAHATTVYYQPTPYPMLKVDGTAISQDINIVHAWEGWVSSFYYSQTFQRTNSLQMGGDGSDQEQMYMKFDLTGLPQNVDQAYLYLMPYATSYPTVSFQVCPVTSTWGLTMTWGSRPVNGTCSGWYPAPTAGSWSGFWLSETGTANWYNQWRAGTLVNNGVVLIPQFTDNKFDAFYSTLYNSYLTDPYADARRPILMLSFTSPASVSPIPIFQMPLPGGTSWLVSNEVGGYECMGEGGAALWPDVAHTGANYFSIDITPSNHDTNGNTVYIGNIPVIAASGGVVVFAGVDSPEVGNGNYVVIDHDGDGNLQTGFSTRYLHMQNISPHNLQVQSGSTVTTGQLLGYMGNTGGVSTGTHLHFGMRYANNGSSNSNVQYVTMEGLLLKSYQTECAVNGSGVPTSRIRYYPSHNVGPGVYSTNN